MITRIYSWCALVICLCAPSFAYGQGSVGYPAVFDTSQVLQLNVSMDPSDFSAVRNDTTFEVEAPAQFWANGELPLNVIIRRMSSDAINGKVSYKIDINKLVDGQKWNNLNKLSLENGDDQDVVSEGLAWYMHRVASGTLAGYSPSMAAWTTLTINGQPQGVYLSAEQVDKQYLKNRSLWEVGDSWLFYQDDLGQSEYKEGPTEVSSTMQALNFAPFASGGGLPPAPSGAQLRTILNDNINMDAMLMLGAVNAFSSNPDEMFNHAKNFFWADFAPGASLGNSNGKRMYFPWDLDSAISGSGSSSIYGSGQEAYQQLIFTDPVLREQFNLIMFSLLEGPLSAQSLTAFLNDMEPVLTPYLAADPNSQIDDAADHFDSLRNWVAARHANVYQQVISDLGFVPLLGDYNRDGVVNASDYVVWGDHFGIQSGATSTQGDGDSDGDVDGADFLIWQRNVGQTSAIGSPSNGAVPEPAARFTFFTAMFAIFLCRRAHLAAVASPQVAPRMNA